MPSAPMRRWPLDTVTVPTPIETGSDVTSMYRPLLSDLTLTVVPVPPNVVPATRSVALAMVTSYVGVAVVLSTWAVAVPDSVRPGMLTVRAPAMSPVTLAPPVARVTATDPEAAKETSPGAPNDSWAWVMVRVVVDEVVVTATLPESRTGPTVSTPEPATVAVVAPAVQLAVAVPVSV